MRVWPFCSKKVMNFSRMLALSMVRPSLLVAGKFPLQPLSGRGLSRVLKTILSVGGFSGLLNENARNENAGRRPRLPAFPVFAKV
jgi:hypothetical protein